MLKKITRADIKQLLRFGIVGTSNAIIDFGVLDLLLWLHPTTNTLKLLGYNSLAVFLGATNSFFWNKYWTFQQRNKITAQELYRFAVLATSTALMNDFLLWLLSKAFPAIMNSGQLGANVLKFFAVIGTMSVSFFGMRLWVFFHKRHATEGQESAEQETSMVYDVTVLVGGVLRPIHEVDTVKMPVTHQDQSDSGEVSTPTPAATPVVRGEPEVREVKQRTRTKSGVLVV